MDLLDINAHNRKHKALFTPPKYRGRYEPRELSDDDRDKELNNLGREPLSKDFSKTRK